MHTRVLLPIRREKSRKEEEGEKKAVDLDNRQRKYADASGAHITAPTFAQYAAGLTRLLDK